MPARARPTTSRRGRSCRRTTRRPTAQQATTTCSTSPTCRASASSRRGSRGTRHDPRGERGRGARGDEPVRRRPALAHLPAADDVAVATTAREPGLLEHPDEAFAYYRDERRRRRSSCEEKHMGSRAVVVVCRDDDGRPASGSASTTARPASCYTRTGRPFFDDRAEPELLGRVRGALRRRPACGTSSAPTGSLLDCELHALVGEGAGADPARSTPPSARRRAAGLARRVAAARSGRRRRGLDVLGRSLERPARRVEHVERYADAYRRYCWPVDGARRPAARAVPPAGHRGRGASSTATTSGTWTTADALVAADPDWLSAHRDRLRRRRDRRRRAQAAATAWWEELTGARRRGDGREAARLRRPRPAGAWSSRRVKCRGREYLRIIYGPEYDAPEQPRRGCASRGLGPQAVARARASSRSGVEALERFVRREPLRRVHECVFGVLALESEPVDPRL